MPSPRRDEGADKHPQTKSNAGIEFNLLLMATHAAADFNPVNISTLEAKVFCFGVLLTLTGCGDCRPFLDTPNPL
jgi:hypothetical protein